MDHHEVRLGDIAHIQVGYQSRGRIEEDLDADHRIIRPQDFADEGTLILGEARRFSPAIDPKTYLVTAGDILVQARGQNHFAYLIENEIKNTVASNSFYMVRLNHHKNVLPAYLAWWLNLKATQAYFQEHRGVSTIPFISKAVLQNTLVRIPPIESQLKISELIRLRHREQELYHQLDEKKELLVQEICRKVTLA